MGSSSYQIANIQMNNIHIDGTGQYGIFYNGAKGNGTYCNLSFANIGTGTNTNTQPAAFTFLENCDNTAISVIDASGIRVISNDDTLTISGFRNSSVSLYDLMGNKCRQTAVVSNSVEIANLLPGIYLVRLDNYNEALKVLVR
jgi:hypothetical protein